MARRRTQESILRDVAQLVREAYNDQRRRWYALRGRDVEDLAGEEQTWMRMAQFMLQHRIENHIAFIHKQFEAQGGGSCCPAPKKCYGPAALRRWEEDSQQHDYAELDARYDLEFQYHRLGTELATAQLVTDEEWTAADADDYVLLDEENTLTPLFRYCLAIKTHRPQVAEAFAQEALMQYLIGRELYDKVWGELIPAQLREQASQLTLAALL